AARLAVILENGETHHLSTILLEIFNVFGVQCTGLGTGVEFGLDQGTTRHDSHILDPTEGLLRRKVHDVWTPAFSLGAFGNNGPADEQQTSAEGERQEGAIHGRVVYSSKRGQKMAQLAPLGNIFPEKPLICWCITLSSWHLQGIPSRRRCSSTAHRIMRDSRERPAL